MPIHVSSIAALGLALFFTGCAQSHTRSGLPPADGGVPAARDAAPLSDAWHPLPDDAEVIDARVTDVEVIDAEVIDARVSDAGGIDAADPSACETGHADLSDTTPAGPGPIFSHAAVSFTGGDCAPQLFVRVSPDPLSLAEAPVPNVGITVNLPSDLGAAGWSGSAPATATLTAADGRTFAAAGQVVMGYAGHPSDPGATVSLSIELSGDSYHLSGLIEAPYCSAGYCL